MASQRSRVPPTDEDMAVRLRRNRWLSAVAVLAVVGPHPKAKKATGTARPKQYDTTMESVVNRVAFLCGVAILLSLIWPPEGYYVGTDPIPLRTFAFIAIAVGQMFWRGLGEK